MELLEKYFADFTEKQREQLATLKGVYEDWNAKINVISRKDMDEFYLHHVLHSLTIAAKFDFRPGAEVLDLGCGGGFPGVPLAIFFPDTSFLLADSIRKKLTVVDAVADAIGLENVQTMHTRAEDIKNRKFDCVVSRAVAPLGSLWHWSKPLLRRTAKAEKDVPNGLVCLKGGDLTEEIQQSNCRPHVWDVKGFFPEPYFAEKYLLYQAL